MVSLIASWYKTKTSNFPFKHPPSLNLKPVGASFGRKLMSIIVSTDGDLIGHFKDYNDLFENLIGTGNTSLTATNQNLKDKDWRFTIHPPQQIKVFFAHLKDSCEAIKEAFEESLPLIEICAGDYAKPVYIAQTPNVGIDYLKRRWCMDYCAFHHLAVREV